MKTKNYSKTEELVLPSGGFSKTPISGSTLRNNLKKLFTLMAVIAMTSFFTAKADWVKNVSLRSLDFTLMNTTFTYANSNISGNMAAGISIVALATDGTGGYMNVAGSGSGGRGNKITNLTDTISRRDTVYYEFDWNPYRLLAQENSVGTTGTEPASYAACIARDAKDSIIFGVWFERWSMNAASKYNTTTGTDPLGDIHLMNISTDPYNPVPAQVVTRTVNAASTSYYTNTLLPFAMLDPSSASYYAAKCDSINKSTNLGGAFKMHNWYHIKAVVDMKNKNIISFDITETGTTPLITASFTNLPFVNRGAKDFSRLEIAGTRGKAEGGTANGVNTDFAERLDNINIYNMKQVASAAAVTIRYKDQNGVEIKTARVTENLEVGTKYKAGATDTLTIVYGNEYYFYNSTSVDSVTVQTGGSEMDLRFIKATPLSTVVTLSAPTTSETYKDVTVSLNVKTATGDIVSKGTVNVLVNGNLKNSFTPDVLGMGTITFPNLLVGTNNISAMYIGDRIAYSSSDTAKVSVEITPTTSTVIPYPVYYDLGTMPEIMKYRLKYTTTSSARVNVAFTADSLSTVTLATDTLQGVKTKYLTWEPQSLNPQAKTADYKCGSDDVAIPFGNGTNPSWITFNTPWLNKGGYNVYVSQRTNLSAGGLVLSATMDGKTLYYPNAELNIRNIRQSANNGRRWCASTNDGLNQMYYVGSVNIETSDVHSLKFTCTSTAESSANQIAWLDMLQFIPVDQDSVTMNTTALSGLAKSYWPRFDTGGFGRMADFTGTVPTTFASINELAVHYQATDPNEYTTSSQTIQHLAVTDPGLGLFGTDYIVVFKRDKWTRVSEGAINTSDSTYTCNLANGDYYYQEYNYTENTLLPGSLGSRVWMKDGTFTVGNPDALKPVYSTNNIRTYADGKTLTVKGIKVGARIMVSDLMGRLLLNTISSTDVFTTTMKSGAIYIVKVVSGNDNATTKVLVK